MSRTQEKIQIFLTDQLKGRPNVKTMSREIMLAITKFYRSPDRADGFRSRNFTDLHRNGWDSGGFQILMGKVPAAEADPMKTVEIYKRVGVKEQDFPIQLDLPPRYDFTHQEKMAWIERGALFYHIMRAEIPYVVPVVHGWTYEEVAHSLDLIENPEKLCTGSNMATAARNKKGPFTTGAGAFLQSGRYVLDEAGNRKKVVGCGTNKAESNGYILDHITSDKSHVFGSGSLLVENIVSTGSFAGSALDWSMGNLNPHSSILDRLATPVPNGVDFGQVPVVDRVKSSPNGGTTVAAGAFVSPETVAVDEVISSRPRSKVIGAGAFLQSGTWACDFFANTPTRKKQAIATALPGKPDVGIQDKVHFKKKQPKKTKNGRAPLKAIIERLALVLNMLRDRTLFMLGGASPNMQHMIFMGGANFSDTSAWRIKGYFAEIYIPERGARSIGYKDTSKRLNQEDIQILRECLNDPTHPFHGMPVDRFIEIGHYNIAEWRKTWAKNQWEVKPFPLRALHNAWVLKCREEVIANEYAGDPDRYHRYLQKRFARNHQLTHRLESLWSRLKRPYVQTDLGIFLKGESVK